MNRFTKSLRFKVTLLVIAVELLILAVVGVYYSHRFSQEVDNAIIARLSIPGLLMSRGELSFDAVSDKRTMEGLLREPYSEGLVIGLNGYVYFSSDPALLDTQMEEINGLRLPEPESSNVSADAPALITPFQDSTGMYLTSLSPLYPDGKLTGYLYLKVGTEISEAEKTDIAVLFAVGSLGTILLTAAILSWLLNLMVIRRLDDMVEVFRRFSEGDYAARSQPSGRGDEIATLMYGFNGLAQRLEDSMAYLRESEQRYRLVFENSPVSIWEEDFSDVKMLLDEMKQQGVLDIEAYFTRHPEMLERCAELVKIVAVNNATLTLHEAENEAVLLAKLTKTFTPESLETFKQELICLWNGQAAMARDAVVKTLAGEPRDVTVYFTVCPGYEETLAKIIVSLVDITERKRAADELRLSSERLQLATHAAQIGIWDWDVVKNELLWDESMYQLYGVQREDFGGAYDAWVRTVHPEDRAYADGEIQAALRGEREYAPEFRIVRPDGSIRYIKAESKTVLDRDGKPLRMIGTNIDITERKSNEAVNAARLHLMQFSLSHSLDDLLEETINQAENLTGSLIGFYHFVDDDQKSLTLQAWSTRTKAEFCKAEGHGLHYAIEEAGVWVDCVRQLKSVVHNDYASLPNQKGMPEGHAEVIRELVTPVFRGDKISAILGVGNKPVNYTEKDVEVVSLVADLAWEVAERKRIEDELDRYHQHLEELVETRTEELRLARDAAEAANKAKSVFLANMSHELRTPLNAILGFSQMMRQDSDLTSAQHENLEIINHSGEHLLKLINDVLEIAKIEAGKLQLEIAPFDLHALVREVSDMMRLRARQKGLQLELDQSSEFPHYIRGDEARLRQILVNLTSNAVKFTEEGSVTIRLGVEDGAQYHLVIEVEDTGPGIGEQDRQRLFKPFVQLAGGTAQGGTGLGLAIVRQFVQLMGGKVEVESTPGKGSLFRVALPLEAADEQEIIRLGGETRGVVTGLVPGQPAYRILVAEDQHDNQLLLARMMSDLGLEVKVADNGEECVRIFKEWRPDLIWMDRRMPLMDGVEATRRIRQLPGGDRVKIVAVTAAVFKEQQSELLTAGMDDTIRKPFQFGEIYDSLERQLGLEFTYRDEEAAGIQAPSVPLTPQMLATVDAELRTELRAAVESLDAERIHDVIVRIGGVDGELAKTLFQLVNEFNYPYIMDVLKMVNGDNRKF